MFTSTFLQHTLYVVANKQLEKEVVISINQKATSKFQVQNFASKVILVIVFPASSYHVALHKPNLIRRFNN